MASLQPETARGLGDIILVLLQRSEDDIPLRLIHEIMQCSPVSKPCRGGFAGLWQVPNARGNSEENLLKNAKGRMYFCLMSQLF